MVCYAVPASAAVAATLEWIYRGRTKEVGWLNLMLYGATVFGFLDHLWYGQLFYSPNIVNDLLLGVLITVVTFAAWGAIVLANRYSFVWALWTYRRHYWTNVWGYIYQETDGQIDIGMCPF